MRRLFKRKSQYEQRRRCIVKKGMIKRPDKARIYYRYREPCSVYGVQCPGNQTSNTQERKPGTEIWKPETAHSPDLALLCGWSTHPAAYLSQLKALSGKYRILTLETRGYWRRSGLGKSNAKTYLDDCADDLKAVMDEEGIGRIVLVGHSMWAGIAMKFYYRFPSWVSGLVLVAPSYSDPRKLGFMSERPLLHNPPLLLFHSAVMLIPLGCMKKYILSRDPISRSALEISVLSIMEEADNRNHAKKMIKNVLRADIRAMSVSMKALFRMDDSLYEKAKEIDVPVLLIGGANDPLISPESVVRLGDRIPNAEVEIWEGVKHFPMLSAPERFNQRIKEFIQSTS
jgi:pimeloyl-ACP methyl ester carboxylesterase